MVHGETCSGYTATLARGMYGSQTLGSLEIFLGKKKKILPIIVAFSVASPLTNF